MPSPGSARRRDWSGSDIDKKIAASFGAVLLLFLIGVAAVSSIHYESLQRREEERLSEAIATLMSESVARVSFSGKYHARLLVEDLRHRLPQLTYISVESRDGLVLAHSDSAMNDTVVSAGDSGLARRSMEAKGVISVDKPGKGGLVKELTIPYRGEAGSEIVGVVRIGVAFGAARRERENGLFAMLALIAILLVPGIWVVIVLSRRFGGAVRSLASQLEGILCNSPQAIVIMDSEGKLLVSSAEYERLFGRSEAGMDAGAFIGHSLSEEDARALSSARMEAIRTGRAVEREVAVRHEGSEKDWVVNAFPVSLDPAGRVEMVCSFIRDMTERKRAEEEIRELNARLEAKVRERTEELTAANRELRDTNASLERALERLRLAQDQLVQTEKLAALGQMAGGMAHELSTPIAAIASAAEGIAERLGADAAARIAQVSALDDEGADYLARLAWRAGPPAVPRLAGQRERSRLRERLEALSVDDADGVAETLIDIGAEDAPDAIPGLFACGGRESVLSLASELASLRRLAGVCVLGAEKATHVVGALRSYLRREESGKLAPVDLREEMETILTLYHEKLKRGIRVEKRYLSGAPALGDKDRLNQIWINIISNALQAMGNEGSLEIGIEDLPSEGGDRIAVTFTDSGPGIAPEIAGRIFEPFFTTKKNSGGIGLGLDICRRIAESMGGSIGVESEPGRTRFTVVLMRAS